MQSLIDLAGIKMKINEKDIERFMDKIEFEPTSGCWLWDGPINYAGYGHFKLNNRNERAHRVSYIIHNGNIPEGMSICHKCDVRACVRPDHLWVGTHKENCLDRGKKKKFCPKGHLLEGYNKKPQAKGTSFCCRICGNAYRDWETDRKSTRLNSSHSAKSRMPSSA